MPGCFLANDNKDWKKAGKSIDQNKGKTFRIWYFKALKLVLNSKTGLVVLIPT